VDLVKADRLIEDALFADHVRTTPTFNSVFVTSFLFFFCFLCGMRLSVEIEPRVTVSITRSYSTYYTSNVICHIRYGGLEIAVPASGLHGLEQWLRRSGPGVWPETQDLAR
jgi:hypothetical protein